MSLQPHIDDALARTPPGRSVWIALSGGLDSSLLLLLAVNASRRQPRPLRALHVNHGLQSAAVDFENHCRALCARLAVPLSVAHVEVNRQAGSGGLEGAAREARYAAFAHHVAEGETLWLAQHRDDQAETFLLAALRGSGVRGLAGMPAVRMWQGRRLERPLLEISRSELETVAQQYELSWCEDPSNRDITLDRNRLRHEIMPRLEERWPQATAALSRAAQLAGEADTLLAELADLDLARLGGEPARLPCALLTELSLPRQRLLIRHCCQVMGLPLPPARRLVTLLKQLGDCPDHDAEVRIDWPGSEARLWRGKLYLLASQAVLADDWEDVWDGRTPLLTPLGWLQGELLAESGEAVTLTLRPRLGGERLRQPRRGGRDLKRLLQEATVPPWERQRLLVVWHANEVVAILDGQGQAVVPCAPGWRLSSSRLPAAPGSR